MQIFVFTGDFPKTNDPRKLTAARLINTVELAASLAGSADTKVKVLENPADFSGEGVLVAGWSDVYPQQLAAVLTKYPTTSLLLNHPMVGQRVEKVRWNVGFPAAQAFGDRPAAPGALFHALPDFQFTQVPREGDCVVLVPPTPPAAEFHGTTMEAWLHASNDWVHEHLPAGVVVKISVHPKFKTQLEEAGMAVVPTPELVKDPAVKLAISLQSGATVDQFLAHGIPVLVDPVHHPLAVNGGLPRWGGRVLVYNQRVAEAAIRLLMAHEVPMSMDGLQPLLAEMTAAWEKTQAA